MQEIFPDSFPEIRNRPSGLLLDTEKVNHLKKVRRMSDDYIARQSGRTSRIVHMTVNNKAQGIETQRAIAAVLGVPLEKIILKTNGKRAA